MSIYRINPELLKSNGASGGDVLTYVSANARVEWSAPTGGGGGTITSDVFNTAANSNTFTLSSAVSDANAVLVTLSGVVQVPIDAYIVSSTTLTLNNTFPLISNLRLEVRYL